MSTTKDARNLGRRAQQAGTQRVPGWDAALMTVVNAVPTSTERQELMKAWLAGWDAAHLAPTAEG